MKHNVLCAQLCPILCDPLDYSLPGSSVYGIFQARILVRFAISYSRGSNLHVLCLLHWQADLLPLSHLGSPVKHKSYHILSIYYAQDTSPTSSLKIFFLIIFIYLFGCIRSAREICQHGAWTLVVEYRLSSCGPQA